MGEVGWFQPRRTVGVGNDRVVGEQEAMEEMAHLAEEINGEGEEHDASLVGVMDDEGVVVT